MFLAYIDDSKDWLFACFSAIVVPDTEWLSAERLILSYRRRLRGSDGIHVTKELHATDFVAGRGDLGSVVSKWRRARIFEETLTFVTSLPNVAVLNACVPRHLEEIAFERLTDRDSKQSTFIQLADLCAYSLLRFENPTPKAVATGIHRSFHLLRPVLATDAFERDPKGLGIIREF